MADYFASDTYKRAIEAAAEAVEAPVPRHIAASVIPWTHYGRQDKSLVLDQETWQQKLRHFDRNGPGIVGASLDMPAATSMLTILGVAILLTPVLIRTWRDFNRRAV